MKPSNVFFAAALALAFSAPLQAEETPGPETVVATVGDTQITLGEMILIRAGLPAQYQSLPNEVLFKGILDQLIQQTVLAASLDKTPPLRVRLALQNEERNMMAAEAVEAMLEGLDDDAAIQAAYDAEYAGAEPETEFNASHILVETEDEAKTLKTEIDDGADFAELAKSKSTGPSGPQGGELGWFSAGMMVKPFEDAVASMTAGDVSDPIQTQFGWHVIRLNETRQKNAPPLEEVRDQIVADLQKTAVEARIEELTAAAEIDRTAAEAIDPELLSNTDLLKE